MALNNEEILKMVLWNQRAAVLQKQREEIDELQGQLLWSMKCLKSKVQDFVSQFIPRSGQLEATQTHNNRVSNLDLNMKKIIENMGAEQRNTTVEAQREEILKLITRIEEIECEATEYEDKTDLATWCFAA